MSWLDNWAKRLKLTINSTNIDDNLTDFPVLVTLISGTNTASVFDELSTVSGTKKIAVTTSSGIDQCYVEIERWDWTNEEANLWVKIPTVSSGTNTDLYLYYDKTKDDNTTYIGDTGDSAAQSVWDSSFVGVWHMSQDPNGDVADAIKDSTSSANHGTPDGSMTSADLVDGKVGKAIDFDGDDALAMADNVGWDTGGAVTVESIIKPNAGLTSKGIICHDDSDYKYLLYITGNSGNISFYVRTTSGVKYVEEFQSFAGSFWSLAGVYDRTITNRVKLYTQGTLAVFDPGHNENLSPGDEGVTIGRLGANYYAGIIDETRISNTARSAAWIKATYYSNWNSLITYGSEQGIPTYYYYGYITENNNPVNRKVSLYNRNTCELVNTTTSSGSNGYYYLTTTVSGEHFIVTFDDDAGEDYNALILDKLLPTGAK